MIAEFFSFITIMTLGEFCDIFQNIKFKYIFNNIIYFLKYIKYIYNVIKYI